MKRRVIRLAAFLLLGAIVNIAVAWTFASSSAAAPSSWETIRFHDSFDACTLSRGSTFGSTIISLAFDLRIEPCCPMPPIDARAKLAPGRESEPALPMSELKGTLLAMEQSTSARDLAEELQMTGSNPQRLPPQRIASLFGWPLRSGWYASNRTIGRLRIVNGVVISSVSYVDTNIVGGLAVDLPRLLDSPAATLPLRPIWPGFALNTLFYAAMLFALILGPFILRRAIRRRRGLCFTCGYDLRGRGRGAEHALCPECGTTIAVPAVARRSSAP